MDHEDAVCSKEVMLDEQDSPTIVEQDDSITDTEEISQSLKRQESDDTPEDGSVLENLQPTVEEVADDPEDDPAVHGAAWAEENGPEPRRESNRANREDNEDRVEGIKRWPSLRTEALIHAAAQDIVAAVGNTTRNCIQSSAPVSEDEETSFVTEPHSLSSRPSYGEASAGDHGHVPEEDHLGYTASMDDGGDNSSHHEHEDDVFSDNSPRSSMGSISEAEHKTTNAMSPQKARSARISDIPQSDADEHFIPTLRGTPRPTFRSPSSVMALQMSSPPASATGTPRSNRRTPRSTVSRLGSPSVSAQYSPRKTPPRFKRNTPPLVLLHVTVLPSRWAWGHVLDNVQPSELSSEGKTLWETWNQLQDRTGDTISDRGILLPHPQNDYEVLEERLLETLELPLRRRARILECGHYLGPSNVMSLPDEIDSEDGYYDEHHSPRQSMSEQTHWCKTCSSQIRYDSLGDGKVYRVKVYASNGLMRAGAWEACWKEMERVDVELEPIVDPKLQEELNCLAAEQERALGMEEEAAMAAAAAVDAEIQQREETEDAEPLYMHEHMDHMDLSGHSEECPEPETHSEPSLLYDEDRRMRDEERLREVYGSSPPPQPESSSVPQAPRSECVPQETPVSPSVEAHERREERREGRQQPYRSASLPELILEAAKVLMHDRRNVLIGLLSLVVLMLAISNRPTPTAVGFQAVVPEPVAPVASEKPFESVSGIADHPTIEVEQESARDAVEAQNELASSLTETVQASTLPQVTDTSREASELLLTSTVEITKTITEVMTETLTETMVETVTETRLETITTTMIETVMVEALPTDMPNMIPDPEEFEVAEEKTELSGLSQGDIKVGSGDDYGGAL
ncbi:hypothetical protein ED733_005782 [Metarhizium rileyi]|uniref:Pathway-specific nitrogen regulator n=1 Tax=Metarhizium rileyi (strain RCEF 4871) TaxID=1649241 RepID=A0A5C6G8F8_METRR|nr:hypothetical protein ED733_005782 [Metarhizium rileyi]